MNYSKPTDRFDIHIDDNAKTITIRQRWKYGWRYDSPNGIKPWTDAEKKYFHNQVLSLITSTWQSAPGINFKGSSDFVKNNVGKLFRFRFDIERVISNEHWAVSANKISSTRALPTYVNWSARKIVIDINDIAPDLKTNGLANALQYPVVHEFGHTIGNVPLLYIGSHGDEYYSKSILNPYSATISQTTANYNDYQSIMNIGSSIRERHFDYLLRELNTIIPGTVFYFNSFMRWN